MGADEARAAHQQHAPAHEAGRLAMISSLSPTPRKSWSWAIHWPSRRSGLRAKMIPCDEGLVELRLRKICSDPAVLQKSLVVETRGGSHPARRLNGTRP